MSSPTQNSNSPPLVHPPSSPDYPPYSQLDVLNINSSYHNESTAAGTFNLPSSAPTDSVCPKIDRTIEATGPSVANLLPIILSHPSDCHHQSLSNNATAIPLDPIRSSPQPNPSSHNAHNHPIKPPSPILPDAPLVNHPISSAPQPSPLNTPSKKNGKPLAKCSFCGMTFKKLEHCQRHERTHTLARPYSCTVCLKAFARQDTLNRHLRLHSRAESRVGMTKSSSQSQHSPTPATTSFLPVTPRERGLSLSALDQSSFIGDLRRDNILLASGPRHSLPLLPTRVQSDHFAHQHPHLFSPHYNQTQSHSSPLNNSDLSLQPAPRSSPSVGNGIPDGLTEVRRGSWCPGVQPFGPTSMLSTSSEPLRFPSNRSHRQSVPEPLYFGLPNWEANLTNTFGLVEAGIDPVPMSAPATCTKWGTLGLSGDIRSSEMSTPSLMTPSWNKLPSFEPPSSCLPYWDALGRLEEEDNTKLERELNLSNNPTQPVVSTSAINDPLIQPTSVPSSFSPREPTTIVADLGQGRASFGHWSYPVGTNLAPPYADEYQNSPPIPVGVVHQELSDHFGNYWNKNQTSPTVEMIDPKSWYRSQCLDPENRNSKVINNAPNSNTIAMSPGWEEVMELGF